MKKVVIIFIILFAVFFSTGIYCQTKGGAPLPNIFDVDVTEETNIEADEGYEAPPPITTITNHTVRLMAEFGLGNIISFYCTFRLAERLHIGGGVGYSFHGEEQDDTSITMIEPSFVILAPINYFLIRTRIGKNYISEKKYGLSSSVTVISPDILLKLRLQELYIGINVPIILGAEGVGVAFGVGLGYSLTF